MLLLGLAILTSPLHVCHGCGGSDWYVDVQEDRTVADGDRIHDYESLPPAARRAFDEAETGALAEITLPWEADVVRELGTEFHVRHEGTTYEVRLQRATRERLAPPWSFPGA